MVRHGVQALGEQRDVLALDRGDERGHERVGDLVVLVIALVLDGMHLVERHVDLLGMEVRELGMQQLGGAMGDVRTRDEVVEVELVLFLSHGISLYRWARTRSGN